MKLTFFSKYSKVYVDSENAMKFSEKRYGFGDNCF